MRYNKIRKMDISNGPGVRVSIFLQGCDFHCEDCFNPETHDFDGGEVFDQAVIEKLLDLSDKEYICGLSILGGEPLHRVNKDATRILSKAFKERFPDKTVWIWTGSVLDMDKLKSETFDDIDVVVDGPFVKELKNPMLKYMGSSNQRPIDVKRSRRLDTIILYEQE